MYNKKPHIIFVLIWIVAIGITLFAVPTLLQMMFLPLLTWPDLWKYYAAWVLSYLIIAVVVLMPRRH